MMTTTALKSFLKIVIPSSLVRLVRNKRGSVRYLGQYDSWQEARDFAHINGGGYQLPAILEKVREAALAVKAGRAVFERDSVLFYEEEYRWPLLSALLFVAGIKGNRLHVLDFGGSLGSCFFQHRKMLMHIGDLKWAIVEQEPFVRVGKSCLEGGALRFFLNMEEVTSGAGICLFNSVLQFVDEPQSYLKKARELGIDYAFIDLTPFSNLPDDRYTVQFVPKSIYNASYPARIFSLERFLEAISQDWEILAHIKDGYPSTTWKGEKVDYRGFFLKRRS